MLFLSKTPLWQTAQQLIKQQQVSLNHFFDHFDAKQLSALAEKVAHTKGKVVFAGVGKSGIIAQHLAMLMLSIGNQSSFLNPTDALHGDLGQVLENDTVIFLSKSGESDELVSLLPHVNSKKAYTVAWVCQGDSKLAKQCQEVLLLPLDQELCPFNLSPTTSSSLQLNAGCLLAVLLMHYQNFSLESYGQNHPSGRIGKRITYLVDDLMLRGEDIPICQEGQTVGDILVELSNKRCGCVLVLDKHRHLKGIFTDGDLRRTLHKLGDTALKQAVEDVMTLQPKVIDRQTLAYEAMLLMEKDAEHPITVLPVLEGKRVVGLIKMHDILQAGI